MTEKSSEKGRAEYLADTLDATIGRYHISYKIESLFDKFLVWARYPEKTRMAALSHSPKTALQYNSYEVGNFDMAYGDYQLGKQKVRAIHGPTPTADRLLEGQLDTLKERKGVHLQHNLEHPGFAPGDLVRIRHLRSVEEKYPETFRLLSTPLDGVAWKLRGEAGNYFTDFETPNEFFLKYGHFAFTNEMTKPPERFQDLSGEAHRAQKTTKRDNGFYVGEKNLTDDQFRDAFKYASEGFAGARLADQKRDSRALQVGAQGFIAVGALAKTLKDTGAHPDELLNASFGQACKLDIDRGVVMNVMTRTLFALATGEEIDEAFIAETIGVVVGRAELVSGRTIIIDRYQPLSDALRLIGNHENGTRQAIKSYLAESIGVNLGDLKFESLQSSS